MSVENSCIKIIGDYPSELIMRELKRFLEAAKNILGDNSILTLFFHNQENCKCGIQINFFNDDHEEAYFSAEGRNMEDMLQTLDKHVTTYALALERTKTMAATISEFSSPSS